MEQGGEYHKHKGTHGKVKKVRRFISGSVSIGRWLNRKRDMVHAFDNLGWTG